MLKVRGLSVAYGGIQALRGVDLDVAAGEIVTLIGANGAGKSTLLAAVSGLVKPSAGQVWFQGREVTGRRAFLQARAGLILVPEGRKVFANLSVRENLILGGYHRAHNPQFQRDLAGVLELFPRLAERLGQAAGTLSGGERQMLALGRALMGRPRLLMMDEPSLGLSPLLVREVFGMIRRIHQQGVTVLLIEQNAAQALRAADRGYVLQNGRVVLSGPGGDLLQDPRVRKSYLGMD